MDRYSSQDINCIDGAQLSIEEEWLNNNSSNNNNNNNNNNSNNDNNNNNNVSGLRNFSDKNNDNKWVEKGYIELKDETERWKKDQ